MKPNKKTKKLLKQLGLNRDHLIPCRLVWDEKAKRKKLDIRPYGNGEVYKARSIDNTYAIMIPDGFYMVDVDSHDTPKEYKAFREVLGVPTTTTNKGSHYYIRSGAVKYNATDIFDAKHSLGFGVDLRGAGDENTKAGLGFIQYDGDDVEQIGYDITGKVINDGDFAIFKMLPVHIREPKTRPVRKASDFKQVVGEVSLADIELALSTPDAHVDNFKARLPWLKMLSSIYMAGGEAAKEIAREWSKNTNIPDWYKEDVFESHWYQTPDGKFNQDGEITAGTLMQYHPNMGANRVEDTFEDCTFTAPSDSTELGFVDDSIEAEVIEPVQPSSISVYDVISQIGWQVKNSKFVFLNKNKSVISLVEQKTAMRILEAFPPIGNNGMRVASIRKKLAEIEIELGQFGLGDNLLPSTNPSEVPPVMETSINMNVNIDAATKIKMLRIMKDSLKSELADAHSALMGDIHYIMEQVITYNQYSTLKATVNPFAKEVTIKVANDEMLIEYNDIFTHTKVDDIKVKEWRKYFDDYAEHFGGTELVQILTGIMAIRFAAERKASFMYFFIESNWGKSLFANLLKKLGLLVEFDEKELKEAIGGKPTGVTENEMIFAIVLMMDEVKFTSSEMKKIAYNISFNSKFKARTEVDVYCKILATAEGLESLTGDGGIEKQYFNRFSQFNGVGDLTKRKLYVENKGDYTRALTYGIFLFLKQEADKYIAMGRSQAERAADDALREFVGNHMLEGTDLVENVNEWLTAEVLPDIFKKIQGMQNLEDDVLEGFCVHKGELYAVGREVLNRVLTYYAKKRYGEDSYKKVKYKTEIIHNLFTNTKDRKMIKGVRYIKCLVKL